MISAQPSTLFALSSAARQKCTQTSSKQALRAIGRRQYVRDVDGVAQLENTSSKLPWILSAGALTAGGAYFFLQPGDSNGQKQREQDKKTSVGKRDWYADDHPKPVEERHGDSVKKHSIAAEKNEYKVRTGVFSKKEFDNHIQKREDDPADEFEKVEKRGDGKKGT